MFRFILFLSIFATSHVYASDCQLTAAEKAAYLKMEFWQFDQTENGWRGFEARGCEQETRDLIDEYAQKNQAALEPLQYKLLLWHSGQISAFMNDYPGAISRMSQTYHDDENPNSTFLWNPYVSATLAFLEGNLPDLKSSREQLSHGSYPRNHINLRVVDSFVRCFGSSYKDAYSRTCTPKESNIDRIRAMAVSINSIDSLPLGIKEYLQDTKVILVGELHGNIETPLIFSQIVRAVASTNVKTLVALEIPISSQSSINLFVKTGDELILRNDSFYTRPDQDGRSSKAMVQLIRDSSNLPGVEIFCMDGGGVSGQDRDTKMAKIISDKAPGFDHVLVLTGNVHGAVTIGTSWDPQYRPMGYELMKMNPQWYQSQIMNIRIRWKLATSWSCFPGSPADCGLHIWPPTESEYSMALPDDRFFLLEDGPTDGYGSTLFIREMHASEPFLSKVE